MCGVVGAYKPADRLQETDEGILVAMRDKMVHRGPDGAGIWSSDDGSCILGHRRLSIIDLSTSAAQPMVSDDHRLAISFNGEIYNHKEIRERLQAAGVREWKTDHSDTEVVLKAYAHWGIEAFQYFKGMFAILIYDGRDSQNPKFHIVRDRIGKKPLYFHRTASGEWLFASEIRALLEHPKVPRAMEPIAFWHYLTFIVTPAPMTMFSGIFKLPAGHVATIHANGSASATSYWSIGQHISDPLTEDDLSFDEAVAQFSDLFRAAISRRMESDVPFGVLLSGGVDSSLNVAMMTELMDQPVRTFTVGYESYDGFNEFEHAQRIADRYKTEHHEMRITSRDALEFLPSLVEYQDEPIADNVCIPLYFLASLVRSKDTTVVQVGEGADENFLGYWWCDHYRKLEEDVYRSARQKRRVGFFQKLLGRMPVGSGESFEVAQRGRDNQHLFWGGAVCWWGQMRQGLTPDPAPFKSTPSCPIEGLLPASFLETDSHNVVSHYHNLAFDKPFDRAVTDHIPAMELSLRLPEHLLMRVDKMTMAHSVEARTPFLDHELVEFAARLPVSYKLSDGIGKRIVKKAAEPYVDEDLLYRRKQGFGAPMDKWFTEESFGSECLAAYMRSDIRHAGYLDDGYIRSMFEAQLSGRTNYGFHLWTVMNAVLWYERWINNNAGQV